VMPVAGVDYPSTWPPFPSWFRDDQVVELRPTVKGTFTDERAATVFRARCDTVMGAMTKPEMLRE
jgi:hypothetical protein